MSTETRAHLTIGATEHPLITQAKARRTKLTFIVPGRDDVFTVWPKDDADRAKLIASAEAQGWRQ